MRKALLVVPILMMVGCGLKPAPRFDRINVGMTKEQVKSVIGEPDAVATQGKTEYWNYKETYEMSQQVRGWWFVRFIDGKVEAFGQRGDFDSTKAPTNKVIIDKTDKVTIDKPSRESFDLATEISKLDKLKKDGLISPEDYEVLKKRAIEKAKE